MSAARKLAAKGSSLLARYAAQKEKTPTKRTTKKRTARGSKKAPSKGRAHPSLVENINRRKRAGTSRPRSRSTVSRDAYARMEAGWPDKRGRSGAKR